MWQHLSYFRWNKTKEKTASNNMKINNKICNVHCSSQWFRVRLCPFLTCALMPYQIEREDAAY